MVSRWLSLWFIVPDVETVLHIFVYDGYKLPWRMLVMKTEMHKNEIGNGMGQERLDSLTLISIENEVLPSVDFT